MSSNSSAIQIPSLRSLFSFASGFLSQFPLSYSPSTRTSSSRNLIPFSNGPSCPIDGPLSCHNSTSSTDSCCFIYPGGQLLQTQFWDTSPSIGPADSWTLHGLWPDLCDGTYPTYCTAAPQYNNITSILQSASQDDLLEYMNSYWLPNSGTSESFWEHEWNKHGTCINTLAPSCYGDGYQAGDEVVDFFTRAVAIFKRLDTYAALKKAGITPSNSQTYTEVEISEALQDVTGAEVVLGCYRGQLNQAWYSFNVKGSLQTGKFVPSEPVGKSGIGTCPSTGIKYLPK